ncbi:LysR family transcriptional regulator [Sphingomonas sp. MAH-20]|uniref:LysR family transcriptional regulator n=1 Tax=Sphingomonas horti TaxID=2682842 RepID=A0A6I4IX72_9SPHN|nr:MULTISPECIES: LysR family transcriptional regulator [Sphingomonas]MBA2920431.1 LysR family transcriptional regulator [Sphingomonas sp. CGMCC 1.13658]MVO76685.1 LysR family transcriptional regulator [Sphingomonas horti]
MRLPDFEAWAIFAAVVEHRSFSAAARALGLSKATVSKAVTRLEAHLGASLFHRTSRALTLTETGRSLAPRARRILDEAVCAEEEASDAASAPKGLVRLAAPMTFGLERVAPAIAEFLGDNPGITIDLCLDDRRIDLVEQGVDVALRIAQLPDSSLRARRLMPIRAHVVASAAYFGAHGRPSHPAELAEHRCLWYANSEVWRFTGPGGEQVSVKPEGPLRSSSGEAMLPALRAGLGITVLPDFIVAADLEERRLEAVLAEWSPPPIALHLVTPPNPLRPARVEALIRFLVEHFSGKSAR